MLSLPTRLVTNTMISPKRLVSPHPNLAPVVTFRPIPVLFLGIRTSNPPMKELGIAIAVESVIASTH